MSPASSISIVPSHAVSHFDEHKWVIQIRRTLDEEEELEGETNNILVSIFSVPKALMAIDQDSYVPQQVAMGPYHYWRQEMYQMERYKLAAAKRMQKHCLQDLKFHDVVQHLVRYEPMIRAHYHKYLTCSGETLVWMIAVDACFLLEFLRIYAMRQGKMLHRISSRMSHLLDVTGRKSADNTILRDLVMLENQIPLFVLRKMLEFHHDSIKEADETLFSMLIGFAKALHPFKTLEELPSPDQAVEQPHLLAFLYSLIVMPNSSSYSRLPSDAASNYHLDKHGEKEPPGGIMNVFPVPCTDYMKAFLHKALEVLHKKLYFIKDVQLPKILKFLIIIPLRTISTFPGVSILWGPIESLFINSSGDSEKDSRDDSDDLLRDKPPLVEEIAIPSVSELSKACVVFARTNGGIKTIRFDPRTRTLHLPSVNLDANTEVTLKNLVAYEACNANGPVSFTRYTELMNGIIDTEEDVRILREKGIISNRMKSDEEVVRLWNGMNRSVRLTKEPFLDKVIEEVNKDYSGMWNVKVKRFVKSYVFGSWQILTLVVCLVFLMLMFLQAYCSMFHCEQSFRPKEYSRS